MEGAVNSDSTNVEILLRYYIDSYLPSTPLRKLKTEKHKLIGLCSFIYTTVLTLSSLVNLFIDSLWPPSNRISNLYEQQYILSRHSDLNRSLSRRDTGPYMSRFTPFLMRYLHSRPNFLLHTFRGSWIIYRSFTF